MASKSNRPMQKAPANPQRYLSNGQEFISSKFTVRDVSHFYQVTNSIILDQELNPVNPADQVHLMAFSTLMIEALEGPELYYGIVGNSHPDREYINVYPTGQADSIELSVEFIRKLLDWMGELGHLQNPSMEDLLDAYFAVFPHPTRKGGQYKTCAN